MRWASKLRTTQTQPIARSVTDSPRACDFLKVDAHLSEEEKDVKEKIRSFVEDRDEHQRLVQEGPLPARELVPEMGSLGMLRMHLKSYGWAGKGAVRTYEGMDEVHTLELGNATTGIPAFR